MRKEEFLAEVGTIRLVGDPPQPLISAARGSLLVGSVGQTWDARDGLPNRIMLHARKLFAAAIMLSSLAGCSHLINARSPDRTDRGYTLVLNGIEGTNLAHAGFVAGLTAGGVESEIEIYDWTTGNPALLLVHLRHESRNRRQAAVIAQKIVDYQALHPGRPVNLIGHSGGGGMALLALEELPPEAQVKSVVLLEAAISSRYDLRKVLPKVDRGLWNYSSLGDSPLLAAGTTLAGTIDGRHAIAAGAIGFELPDDATDADRQLYAARLYERPYDFTMLLSGNPGEHYGCLSYLFACKELAPLLHERD
jgi:hypothetical protein